MMWLPNPLSLYHKEGFLVSKDFYSTASSGGLFALKLTSKTPQTAWLWGFLAPVTGLEPVAS